MTHLDLSPERRAYRPGETITVQLRWSFEQPPRAVLINLLWYTQGKGDEDVQVVTGETIEDPGASGERAVSFQAPAHPPSFSGTLITLSWALEALSDPDSLVVREEIVIAPEGSELRLPDPGASA
jgi:hypothetical protein